VAILKIKQLYWSVENLSLLYKLIVTSSKLKIQEMVEWEDASITSTRPTKAMNFQYGMENELLREYQLDFVMIVVRLFLVDDN